MKSCLSPVSLWLSAFVSLVVVPARCLSLVIYCCFSVAIHYDFLARIVLNRGYSSILRSFHFGSFLTVPLGTFLRLTKDGLSQLGISNLYNSISSLGDGNYFESGDVRTMLLCPKLDCLYYRVTDFLPIYEVNKSRCQFLKGQATFIVFNELEVTASPSIATISKCNTLGVPVGDLEVLDVSIGEPESLLLLKTSVTSILALTDFFNEFGKKLKVKQST
ncbi:hypothetical protein L2E82_21744 [Cichorium intybus]|uniref:Uncharacterized protein n=1 Tax=Cichorium intybus TaxID=13427 RepID=A0ACB9DX99_CICIN|nr:hypothetical protein L2E82_21744 [Cichorium intybus]